MNKRWYAIYTKSRAEKKVEKDLKEKGIETYLPLQKKLRIWSDRRKTIEMPLFSGYVFVNINLVKERYFVLQTDNVVKFVSFSGEISEVKQNEIDTIKWILGENLPIEPTSTRFAKGQKVKVVFGDMKDLEGEVIRTKKNKVLFRISSIQQNMLVEIPEHYIENI